MSRSKRILDLAGKVASSGDNLPHNLQPTTSFHNCHAEYDNTLAFTELVPVLLPVQENYNDVPDNGKIHNEDDTDSHFVITELTSKNSPPLETNRQLEYYNNRNDEVFESENTKGDLRVAEEQRTEHVPNKMQDEGFDSDDSVVDKNYEPSDDNNSSTDSKEEDEDDHEGETEGQTENELVKSNMGNNNESDEEAQERVFRKKARNPSQWKRNLKKLKVNSGLPYITEGSKEKSGRTLKPPCGINCRTKCNEKFSHEARKEIHSRFWNLKDNALQRQFVASHLEKLCTKYRRTVEGSSRGINLSYFLTLNGMKVKVCKKFFMNTLDIGDRFIRTTWKKSDGKGSVGRDRRGNFMRREAVAGLVKDKIREHINSFQRIESHYLRSQTTKEYIDGSLTLAQMYRYYKFTYQHNGL